MLQHHPVTVTPPQSHKLSPHPSSFPVSPSYPQIHLVSCVLVSCSLHCHLFLSLWDWRAMGFPLGTCPVPCRQPAELPHTRRAPGGCPHPAQGSGKGQDTSALAASKAQLLPSWDPTATSAWHCPPLLEPEGTMGWGAWASCCVPGNWDRQCH